jgi:hypothetical protein
MFWPNFNKPSQNEGKSTAYHLTSDHSDLGSHQLVSNVVQD